MLVMTSARSVFFDTTSDEDLWEDALTDLQKSTSETNDDSGSRRIIEDLLVIGVEDRRLLNEPSFL